MNDQKIAPSPTPTEILRAMAKTFEERQKMYGSNYRLVGPVMAALFPNGMQLKSAQDFELWHLFELMVVKLTRFATSNLTHQDSMHDSAVYAAMIEAILIERHSPSTRAEQ